MMMTLMFSRLRDGRWRLNDKISGALHVRRPVAPGHGCVGIPCVQPSRIPHPRPLRSVWTKVVRPSVGVTCEQFKDTIRDHFGRSGRKWSGRVWGSLASNSKIPSATTSVGLDESGPAECGGHLRAIQRYHPRPLRSVGTIVVRPSVGVTCEQFKDTIRDHFGRSGR